MRDEDVPRPVGRRGGDPASDVCGDVEDGVGALAGYVADAIVFVLDFILGTGS